MMNHYRSNQFDYVWLMLVILHTIGPSIITAFLQIPYGMVIINSLCWIYIAYANRSSKTGILISGIGWSITLYMMSGMTFDYCRSFLMNAAVFVYILYLHFGSPKLMFKENHFHLMKWKEIICLIPMTLLALIAATYVHSVSLIFFKNYTVTTLSQLKGNFWSSIIVLAVAPAFAEEFAFRGFLFQRRGNKKESILLSAILFAALHMNFNQILYAFMLGLIFAFILYMTDNLAITVTMHLLFNLYNILTSYFSETGFVKMINRLNIGGYHLLSANFVEGAHIQPLPLVIGFLIMALSLTVLFGMIYVLCGKNERIIREAKEQKKLGFITWLGLIYCILIALVKM